MAFGKWLGGVLGFMSGGPLGALAGFALGALFDKGVDSVNQPYTNNTFDGDGSYDLATAAISCTSAAGLRGSAQFVPLLALGVGILHHQGRRQGDALRDGVCAPVLAHQLRRGCRPRWRTDTAQALRKTKGDGLSAISWRHR